MPPAIAALPIILDLITRLTPGFMHLIQWVLKIRPILKQDAAWTPELEEAFVQALIATKTDPAYQPDAVVSPVPAPPTS